MKTKLLLCSSLYGLFSLSLVHSATVGVAGEDTQILGNKIKLNGISSLENIETRPLIAVGGFRYAGWQNYSQTIVSYNGRLYTIYDASEDRKYHGSGSSRNFRDFPKAMMHMVIDRSTGNVVPINGQAIEVHNDEAQLLAAIDSYFDEQYIHIVLSWAECFDFTSGNASELEQKMLSLGASREALEMTRRVVPAEMGNPIGSTYGDESTYSYVLIGIPGIGAGNGMEATQEIYDLNVNQWSSPVISTLLMKATVGFKDNQAPRFTPVGMLNNSLIQDDGDLWAAKGIEGGADSHTNNNGGIAVGSAAVARGAYAAAFGSRTEAGPDMSFVAGNGVELISGKAPSASVALGVFNFAGSGVDTTTAEDKQPVFVIGAGTGDNASQRKDAFIVRKDGSVTIGGSTGITFTPTGIDQPGTALRVTDNAIFDDDVAVYKNLNLWGNNAQLTFKGEGVKLSQVDQEMLLESTSTWKFLTSQTNHQVEVFRVNRHESFFMSDLGIGTATPEARLHVDGDAKIDGTIAISGGNPAADRVLTAVDGDGNAEWRVLNPNNVVGNLNVSGAVTSSTGVFNGVVVSQENGRIILEGPPVFDEGDPSKVVISQSRKWSVDNSYGAFRVFSDGVSAAQSPATLSGFSLRDIGNGESQLELEANRVLIRHVQGDVSMGNFQ
ncbi:MAG: hypothetical protein Q7P63_01415 [Verrucomicrobiota bacterium JB022]|nr:hypothetical protein [Verrucomicrobiota bacterium JB022]